MTVRQLALVAGLAAATGGLFALSFYDYWLFHSIVETIVVVLGGITTFLGLTSTRLRQTAGLAVIAAAQGGVAVLTFLHSRSFLGINVFSGQADDAGLQFRTVALLLEATIFAIGMTPLASRVPPARAAAASLTAAAIITVVVLRTDWLPALMVEDKQFTQVFHASQIGLFLIFATLLAVATNRRARLGDAGPPTLVIAAIAALLLGEATMALAVHIAIEANFFAHVLKVAAHSMLFCAAARAAEPTADETPKTADAPVSDRGRDRARARMLEAILDSALERVLFVDADGIVRHASRSLERDFGLSPRSGTGRPCPGSTWPETLACFAATPRRLALETGRPVVDECEIPRDDGAEPVRMEYRVTPVVGHPGVPDGTVMVCHDVTAQKRLEQDLRASLENNRTLMMEMHHRVKNNLHIVSSILQMKAWRSRDIEVRQKFEDACGRILSLAKVHEMLYRERTFSSIDFGEYARILCEELLCMCSAPRDRIHLDMACEPLHLHVDQAIPLGLILHELVTNCLKHAFNADGGRIAVILRGDTMTGQAILRVEDDGTGTAGSDSADETFGLRMVDALVAQLRGHIDRGGATDDGTAITVSFPLQRTEEPLEMTLPLMEPKPR